MSEENNEHDGYAMHIMSNASMYIKPLWLIKAECEQAGLKIWMKIREESIARMTEGEILAAYRAGDRPFSLF